MKRALKKCTSCVWAHRINATLIYCPFRDCFAAKLKKHSCKHRAKH